MFPYVRFHALIHTVLYRHLTKQAESLLPKFYGVFGLWSPASFSERMNESAMEGDSKSWWPDPEMWLVVMQNIFETPLDVHLKFDLKGSKFNRNVRTEPLKDTDIFLRKRRESVYKDLDYLGVSEKQPQNEGSHSPRPRVIPSCRKIKIGRLMKKILMQQLQVDTMFLQKHGIMDYSLLLGIHNLPAENVQFKPSQRVRTLIPLKRGSSQKVDEAIITKIKARIKENPYEKNLPSFESGLKTKEAPYVSLFRRNFGGILSEVFTQPLSSPPQSRSDSALKEKKLPRSISEQKPNRTAGSYNKATTSIFLWNN